GCSTRILKRPWCCQMKGGCLNPLSDQNFRRYALTRTLQKLQNGPVIPNSANIACVESTERLSQCFSARPEYHCIAN
ncbi:MAG: hypothetical protein ACO3S7_15890, partial [bacterium]